MDGLVSDGATSDRHLWSKLWVSGEKDTLKKQFDHHLHDKRHVINSLMHSILSRMSGIDNIIL